MYFEGKGVAKDDKKAHMWLNIAAANEFQGATETRDAIAKLMSPEDVRKAQDMAREWLKNH